MNQRRKRRRLQSRAKLQDFAAEVIKHLRRHRAQEMCQRREKSLDEEDREYHLGIAHGYTFAVNVTNNILKRFADN